jgi:hypothetical protein
MFLRWLRYRDKAGHAGSTLTCSRRGAWGGKARQISYHSLRICIQQGLALDEQARCDLWDRRDHALDNRPTPTSRANIERVFAAEVGPRPPMTAFARAMQAVLSSPTSAAMPGRGRDLGGA